MENTITVVIGTLNRPQVALQLIEQLMSVSKKTPIEVFLIDQSSPDQYSLLKVQFPALPQFHLIHFDTPHTCKYLNYGWQHATSNLILYLDDDVSITEKTIEAHRAAYADKNILGVAGRVINDGEKSTTDDKVGKVLWNGAMFAKNFSYTKSSFVDFPYGCNMSFRKQTLADMGGFDEKLSPPIYSFNEVDLGYRISKKWKNSLIFSPDALVYHHQYKRGGTRNDFEIKEVTRSNNFNYGYFLGKNFSWRENVICFLRRLPYQLVKEPSVIPDIIKGFQYGKKA